MRGHLNTMSKRGISHLTGEKKLVQVQSTDVLDHLLTCQHSPSFDNFELIGCEPNDFNLTLIESILINRDKPILNKTIRYVEMSIILYLYICLYVDKNLSPVFLGFLCF